MKKEKKIYQSLIVISLLVFSISFSSAFSVVKPYLEKERLYLSPGGEYNLQFVIQETQEGIQKNIGVEISSGSEILENIDNKESYLVTSEKPIPVNFKVSIPKSVDIGVSYLIKITFYELSESSVTRPEKVEHSFEVIVGDSLEESSGGFLSILFLGLAILLLGIAIFFFFWKKRQEAY